MARRLMLAGRDAVTTAGRDARLAGAHRLVGRRVHRRRVARVRKPDPRGQRPTAQCLPVVVLHARRHPRSARDVRHRLAAYTDGAGCQIRADRRESAAAHVSVDVLALPRRDLDRRVYLRLLDRSAAMSALDTAPAHAAGHGNEDELDHDPLHITVGGYVTGFVLSGILSASPVCLVVSKAFAHPTVTALIL